VKETLQRSERRVAHTFTKVTARAQGAQRVRYVPPLEAPLEVYVRQVTLLLRGETPPRRARVRAAAAAAAASSGPIGTIGLL
jgi:hypothetical protein